MFLRKGKKSGMLFFLRCFLLLFGNFKLRTSAWNRCVGSMLHSWGITGVRKWLHHKKCWILGDKSIPGHRGRIQAQKQKVPYLSWTFFTLKWKLWHQIWLRHSWYSVSGQERKSQLKWVTIFVQILTLADARLCWYLFSRSVSQHIVLAVSNWSLNNFLF